MQFETKAIYEVFPEFRNLVKYLNEEIGELGAVEKVDDIFQIETDSFRIQYGFEDDVFDIQAIKVFQEGRGIGRGILTAIHQFCEENEYAVIASDVEDTARGFWEELGYQEGSVVGEFFKIA